MTATARQSAASRKQPATAMLNANAFTVKRLLALLIIFTVLDASRALELGDKCQHDMDCTDFIKGSSCSALGYCECAPYFVQLDSKRCLSSQLLGGDCQLSEQCSMKVANSSCLDGACRCVEGFLQFRKHTCLGPAHPGAVCYSHAHCQMFDTRTHCDFLIPNLFGRCQCTSPAKMVGGLCVAPAADQEEQAIEKVEQPASTTTTTTTPKPTTTTTRRTTTTTTTTPAPTTTTRRTTTTTTTTPAPILLEDELPASVEEQSLEEDDGQTTKLRPEVAEVDNGEKLEAVDMAHEETELTQQQHQEEEQQHQLEEQQQQLEEQQHQMEEQQHQLEEQQHQEQEQQRVEQEQHEKEQQQQQTIIAQPNEPSQSSQDATTGVQHLLTPADVPTENAINVEQETEAGPTEDYPYKLDEEYAEEHNDKPEAPELIEEQPQPEESPVSPEIAPIEADEEVAEASGGQEIASSPIDDTMKFDYENPVEEAEPEKPEEEQQKEETIHQQTNEGVVPIDTESETDAEASTEPPIQTQLVEEDEEPETSQTVADEDLIPVNEAEIESATKPVDELPEDLASGDHELEVAEPSHDEQQEQEEVAVPPKQEEPTEALKIEEQPGQVESESQDDEVEKKPEQPDTEMEMEIEKETPATEAAEVELPATETKIPDMEAQIDQAEQSADIKPTSGEDDLNEANQLNQDQVTEPATVEQEEIAEVGEEKEPEQVVEIHQDADEATTEKPVQELHGEEEVQAITEAEHEQLTYPANDDELAPVETETEPELTTEEPEIAEITTELPEEEEEDMVEKQHEEAEEEKQEVEEPAREEEQQVEPEENANAIKTPEVSEAIAEPQAEKEELELQSATEKEIEAETSADVEEEPAAVTEQIQEPANDEILLVDADQAKPEQPIKSDGDISLEATEQPESETEPEAQASESYQTLPEISKEQDEFQAEKDENDNIIQGAEPNEEEQVLPEPEAEPEKEEEAVTEAQEQAAVPEEEELSKPEADYTSVEHLQELSQPEETTAAAIEAEEESESTLAPEIPESPIAIVSDEQDPEHDPQNFHESESIADILSDLMLEGDSTVPPVPFGQQPAQTVPMVEANSENEEEQPHEAISDLQAEADETQDHVEQVQPAGEPEPAIPELFAEAANDEEEEDEEEQQATPVPEQPAEEEHEPTKVLEEEQQPIEEEQQKLEEEPKPTDDEHQQTEEEHRQEEEPHQQDEAEISKEEEPLQEVNTDAVPEEATTESIQKNESSEEERTLSPEELPFEYTDHPDNSHVNELESANLIVESTTSIDGLQELDNNHIEEEPAAAHAIPHEEATPNPADIVEITTQTMLGLASRVTLMEPAAPVVTTLMPLMPADEPTPEPASPAVIPPAASLAAIKPGSELRKRVDLGLEAVSLGLACSSDRQCQLADPHTVCNGRGVCDCAAGDQGSQCSAERTGCSPGTFQCRSSGVCISWFFVCDGRADCNDASDEECTHNARLNQTCPTESFRCQRSGRCISRAALCDGRRQCPHGEDELGCDGSLRGGNACPEHTFRCGSGECLPEYEYCNAIVSCKDGSDEPPHLCGSRALPNLFMRLIEAGGLLGGGRREADAYCPHRCSNGLCRSTAIVCSGRDGCGDGTDEQTCAVCRCPAPNAASLPAFLARQRPMPLW
ncbi:trichohyalin [Drosophila biarmipes]|uniref:trichohyalin n=1 Tax=Drosophila biarmipes TaxID=125945 RepID=UPI0007E8AF44|nr:trichohyalin [Drosophila biarmipes]XP_050742197.1 trichohyalin [Drosophila biarmipes]